MVNLILDCSCGMSVFVVDNEKIYSKIDNVQNKHSDELLLVVDGLLNDAGKTINDVDNICVCIGPGSFTGVRVAISLAKGLAVGLNAKVFTLSNFDIFNVTDNINSVLVLDGFSNFVYVRKFLNGEKFDECVEIEKLKSFVLKNNSLVCVSNEKTQSLLKKHEIQSNICKNNVISAFNEIIAKGLNTDLNKIYPAYLRASQAEIEREKKQKNG